MTNVDKSVYMSKLLSCYESVLNDRQREILSLHYDDDLSLSEIAEQCDISKQGVSQCLKKAEEDIVELEEKLHLLEKRKAAASLIGEAKELSHGEAAMTAVLDALEDVLP